MSSRGGFTVTRQYLGLATAWRAESRRGARGAGRVVGVNAEMDALPGIGHACGHNLIAMAGVAIALALRAALEKHNVPGTVVLLGTPGACVFGAVSAGALTVISCASRAHMCLNISTCGVPPVVYRLPPHSRGKWRRQADPAGEGRL